MIPHLLNQRHQMLPQGTQAPAQDQAVMPRPELHDLGEPTAEQRRARPTAYLGCETASTVLSALDLTFQTLRASHIATGKPILGVGESYSTVALEATLLGIPAYSTDLCCDVNRKAFLSGIRSEARGLKETYTSLHKMPAGFREFAIKPEEWEGNLEYALQLVNQRMSQCSASRITLPNGEAAPDRFFDTVYSHHAVPKYSIRQIFLNSELPELLRVTHHRLVIAPLVTAGPGDELLHVQGSENRDRLEAISNAFGFKLHIFAHPALTTRVKQGALPRGFDHVGVFTRSR